MELENSVGSYLSALRTIIRADAKQVVPLAFAHLAYLAMFCTIWHLFVFLSQSVEGDGAMLNFFIDCGLIGLFIAQHSLMALRGGSAASYGQFWQRSTVAYLSRSTYILATAATLEFLMYNWKPLGIVWSVQTGGWLSNLFAAVSLVGWCLILAESFVMDHLELLGIKQVLYFLQGAPDPMGTKSDQARRLYAHMRHPILIGVLVVLWTTPVMRADRLLLALMFTAYALLENEIDRHDVAYVKQQLAM